MNEEIKEILDNLYRYKDEDYMKYQPEDILTIEDVWLLLDYITNLQEENERLKEIARKMHLWIFLHSGNEQEVYDELGLTDEENAMLGYSGQFRLQGEDKE